MISEWSRMDFQMRWANNIGQFIVMNIQRACPEQSAWPKKDGHTRRGYRSVYPVQRHEYATRMLTNN